MKTIRAHRNAKGQFAKANGKTKVVREIYTISKEGKKHRIGTSSEAKTFKNESRFTGVITIFNNKRVSFSTGQKIDKGWVWFDGVKIFQLKRGEILGKEQVENIKKYLDELSGKKKTIKFDMSIEKFIKSVVYIDFYTNESEEDDDEL